ncbi:MAG: hypothetical protein REI95_00695 [Oxalicibacterium faecigallinarum]|uniref:hypothetical protein n=1 Tax=Oxalicibacterium faecigallinarum TaxID=573741 RepID=UPI002806A169|nr:hypothetical protein [Oxalicibacterium faecigallinarum]MDQ7968135.1 hypothetical protein [Oxalicibacterium faecigallinarum]
MKSRSLMTLCLSLLLLFSQQMAFAGALDHVQRTAFDHQCTMEEGAAADGELFKHLAIDECDDAPTSAVYSPAVHKTIFHTAAVAFEQLFYVTPSHYFSRAPPPL